MSVDLKISGLTGGMSVLTLDGELIILEHGVGQDRVKRILYENIESILVWEKIPWLRMIGAAVFLGLLIYVFGAAYRTGRDETSLYVIFILGVLLVLLEAIFLIRKDAHMRINHGAEPYDLTAPAYPWRIRKFVQKVRDRAETVQKELREKRAMAQEGGAEEGEGAVSPPP